MSGNSSRKPSGSSTHSRAHSPLSSPSTGHSQRNLNPAAAANMYGVGIGNTNGLKGRNSGWQVWGSATPSSRNASVSSATSGNDFQASQPDSSFRPNFGEGWTVSRSTSGTWDEASDVQQKKDLSPMDAHAQLNLHHARQLARQATVTQAAFSGPRIDDRSMGPKNGHYSPQRYDTGLNQDSNGPRFPTTPSPTRSFPTPAYSGQPIGTVSSTAYDSLQPPSSAVDELSLALRGMAVEDDHQIHLQLQSAASQSTPHIRGPPPMPHPRPYAAYPQAEYNTYYMPPAREPYVDYQYGYGRSEPPMYSSPAMGSASTAGLYPGVAPQVPTHPSGVPDMHRTQPGVFFDYGGARSNSQFYYATHQPVMYPPPPPPVHSPMITPHVPATLSDKKRELQYNIQQQLSSHSLMYGAMRSTPSPHPQAYPTAIDYTQIPFMMPGPGGIYGQNLLHLYPHNVRSARRNDINEHSSALRSPLLDEFRANKARKWELRDIFGYIVEFSGDQHGSRFIQQKLETATSEEKQIVFDEIVPANTLQLIQDVFGNYVIQKLFEHGTQVQKTLLANTMEGHVLTLSSQMYGCRVVQKAIEYVLPEQQAVFVRELEPHILKCVKDSNGNHVIQKLIERVTPDRLGFVQTFRGNVYDLATHPYGCRVLQRCLEHLPDENTRPLMEELHKYTVNLMQDQFGNYVIQYILEHGKPSDKALVISKLRGQMLQMARHKFASNVIEKALVCADPESRRMLVDEIMYPKQDGVSPIITMMKDQFANYVLQRALAVVDGEQREALISRVKPQLLIMRRYSSAYTKHLSSIERLIEKYSGGAQPAPQLTVIPPDHTR